MKKIVGILTTAGNSICLNRIRCSKSYKDGLDRDLDEELVDDSSLHFSVIILKEILRKYSIQS